MEQLNKREETVLDFVVRDFVRAALPVSSKHVYKSADLGVSPATIRCVMNRLDDLGLLSQPHISAGREPTDKGYRYFVDNLMQPESFFKNVDNRFDFDNAFLRRFAKEISNKLNVFASVSLFGRKKMIFSSGVDGLFKQPEFQDYNVSRQFARILDNVENITENYLDYMKETEAEVFIGKENPVESFDSFGSVVGRVSRGGNCAVIFALGPKRMDYEKSFSFISNVCK